ncbi:uncharacterized protein LOC112343101 [Selaginella moellendorffii]|uniref:uncharacterized protein LOC112343101 n=1 Tax=Selaginella moellendorffii TaxID=88036 RepID=UPI000D1CCC81|nr:uncharacterized protein LOC112343101 [Selaginella moellendorffii]|eukprot:XP_024521769.1 uncharacterized protein LOC112343101 [Selaginella moellendorffii]
MAMADDPIQDVLVEAGQRQSGATVAAPIEMESASAGEKVLDDIDDGRAQDEEEFNGTSAVPPVELEKDSSENAIGDDPDEITEKEGGSEAEQEDVTKEQMPAVEEETNREPDECMESTPANDGSKEKNATNISVSFPLARIKNIIKLDKEIKVVARPALMAITQAAQQFIESLTSIAFSEMLKGKRKSLRLSHLEAAVKRKREFLDFLDESMDIFEEKDDSAEEEGEEEEENDDPKAKRQQFHPPPPGARCITDFFGNRQAEPSGGQASSSGSYHQQDHQVECGDY